MQNFSVLIPPGFKISQVRLKNCSEVKIGILTTFHFARAIKLELDQDGSLYDHFEYEKAKLRKKNLLETRAPQHHPPNIGNALLENLADRE